MGDIAPVWQVVPQVSHQPLEAVATSALRGMLSQSPALLLKLTASELLACAVSFSLTPAKGKSATRAQLYTELGVADPEDEEEEAIAQPTPQPAASPLPSAQQIAAAVQEELDLFAANKATSSSSPAPSTVKDASSSSSLSVSDVFCAYRSIRVDELETLSTVGLQARLPDAQRTVSDHVLHGSSKDYPGDQYISATLDLSVARRFGVFNHIVRIDLRKLTEMGLPHYSLDNVDARNCLLSKADGASKRDLQRAFTFAARSREVLLVSRVPPEALELLQPSFAESSLWPSAADWKAVALDNTQMRDAYEEKANNFPHIILQTDWKLLGPYKPPSDSASAAHWSRFLRVQHGHRQFLAFCGTPNLSWRSEFGQRMASEEDLVRQCQTEVVTAMLYSLLGAGKHIPPCVLHVCTVQYTIAATGVAVGTSVQLPLLLYDVDPRQVVLASLPASEHSHDVHSAVNATFTVDALLGNYNAHDDIFVHVDSEAAAGAAGSSGSPRVRVLRCGLHSALHNRLDGQRLEAEFTRRCVSLLLLWLQDTKGRCAHLLTREDVLKQVDAICSSVGKPKQAPTDKMTSKLLNIHKLLSLLPSTAAQKQVRGVFTLAGFLDQRLLHLHMLGVEFKNAAHAASELQSVLATAEAVSRVHDEQSTSVMSMQRIRALTRSQDEASSQASAQDTDDALEQLTSGSETPRNHVALVELVDHLASLHSDAMSCSTNLLWINQLPLQDLFSQLPIEHAVKSTAACSQQIIQLRETICQAAASIAKFRWFAVLNADPTARSGQPVNWNLEHPSLMQLVQQEAQDGRGAPILPVDSLSAAQTGKAASPQVCWLPLTEGAPRWHKLYAPPLVSACQENPALSSVAVTLLIVLMSEQDWLMAIEMLNVFRYARVKMVCIRVISACEPHINQQMEKTLGELRMSAAIRVCPPVQTLSVSAILLAFHLAAARAGQLHPRAHGCKTRIATRDRKCFDVLDSHILILTAAGLDVPFILVDEEDQPAAAASPDSPSSASSASVLSPTASSTLDSALAAHALVPPFYIERPGEWQDFEADLQIKRRVWFRGAKASVAQQMLEVGVVAALTQFVQAGVDQGVPLSDQSARTITLLHESFAGGSTLARALLWSMRFQVAGALVKVLPSGTATQATLLRDAALMLVEQSGQPILLVFEDDDAKSVVQRAFFSDEAIKQVKEQSTIELLTRVFVLCVRRVLEHTPVNQLARALKPNHIYLPQLYEKSERQDFVAKLRTVNVDIDDETIEKAQPGDVVMSQARVHKKARGQQQRRGARKHSRAPREEPVQWSNALMCAALVFMGQTARVQIYVQRYVDFLCEQVLDEQHRHSVDLLILLSFFHLYNFSGAPYPAALLLRPFFDESELNAIPDDQILSKVLHPVALALLCIPQPADVVKDFLLCRPPLRMMSRAILEVTLQKRALASNQDAAPKAWMSMLGSLSLHGVRLLLNIPPSEADQVPSFGRTPLLVMPLTEPEDAGAAAATDAIASRCLRPILLSLFVDRHTMYAKSAHDAKIRQEHGDFAPLVLEVGRFMNEYADTSSYHAMRDLLKSAAQITNLAAIYLHTVRACTRILQQKNLTELQFQQTYNEGMAVSQQVVQLCDSTLPAGGSQQRTLASFMPPAASSAKSKPVSEHEESDTLVGDDAATLFSKCCDAQGHLMAQKVSFLQQKFISEVNVWMNDADASEGGGQAAATASESSLPAARPRSLGRKFVQSSLFRDWLLETITLVNEASDIFNKSLEADEEYHPRQVVRAHVGIVELRMELLLTLSLVAKYFEGWTFMHMWNEAVTQAIKGHEIDIADWLQKTFVDIMHVRALQRNLPRGGGGSSGTHQDLKRAKTLAVEHMETLVLRVLDSTEQIDDMIRKEQSSNNVVDVQLSRARAMKAVCSAEGKFEYSMDSARTLLSAYTHDGQLPVGTAGAHTPLQALPAMMHAVRFIAQEDPAAELISVLHVTQWIRTWCAQVKGMNANGMRKQGIRTCMDAYMYRWLMLSPFVSNAITAHTHIFAMPYKDAVEQSLQLSTIVKAVGMQHQVVLYLAAGASWACLVEDESKKLLSFNGTLVRDENRDDGGLRIMHISATSVKTVLNVRGKDFSHEARKFPTRNQVIFSVGISRLEPKAVQVRWLPQHSSSA